MHEQMSVRILNISKTYGRQKALDDVTVEIGEGEIVGLLGPNGAGKSTLMKITTGYLAADAGHVEVCGYDIDTEPVRARSLIGYLPEHNPLYPDMYVREYLTMVAHLYKINAPEAVAEIIERTGLTPESHKKIASLSKGYRQRVGIAQALIGNPKVVILDEPTTGLDPNQIDEIRALIREIGRDKTVILSTHLMQEVNAICDRVIIIDKGHILADGKAAAIADKVGGGMAVEVLFDKDIDVISAEKQLNAKITLIGEHEYRVESSQSEDLRAKTFNYAVANNLVILSLLRTDNNIESIFHKLTRGL